MVNLRTSASPSASRKSSVAAGIAAPSAPASSSPRPQSSSPSARSRASSVHGEQEEEKLAEEVGLLLPTQGYLLLRDRATKRRFYDTNPRSQADIKRLVAGGGALHTPVGDFDIVGSESEASVPCQVYSKNVSRPELIRRLVAALDLHREENAEDVVNLRFLSKRELCDMVRGLMVQNYYDLVQTVGEYRDSPEWAPSRHIVAIGQGLGVPRPLDLVFDVKYSPGRSVVDLERYRRSKARYVKALLASAKKFEPHGLQAVKQAAARGLRRVGSGISRVGSGISAVNRFLMDKGILERW